MSLKPNAIRDAGLAALKRGDAPEAIRILVDEVRRTPEDGELCGLLGVAHGMTGDLDAAVHWLRQATQLDPSASAFYNLGGALERAGQRDEAVSAYRRALLVDSQHPRARTALTRLDTEAVDLRPLSAVPSATGSSTGPAVLAGESAEVTWVCGCGSRNDVRFRYCPVCGKAEPAAAVEVKPEADSSAEAPANSPPPAAAVNSRPRVRRRSREVVLVAVAIPLLIVLGIGLGLWIRSLQSEPAGSTTLPTEPPTTSDSTQIAPTPQPPPPSVTDPVTAPAPPPGLGVGRDSVIALLRRVTVWEIVDRGLDSGGPRTLGKSADGLTEAELHGSPDDLAAVWLHFAVPEGDAWSVDSPNGVRTSTLLDELAPGAARWALDSLAQLIASHANGERSREFMGRTVRVTWEDGARMARVGLVPGTGAGTTSPAPITREANWLREPVRIPLARRYRFTPHAGGDAIAGTLLGFADGVYTVGLESSGEKVELRADDGYDVEPVEPTTAEQEWLRQAEEERRTLRQAALKRGDQTGRPLEVGRRYRFRLQSGNDLEGTIIAIDGELLHIQPEVGGDARVLRPELLKEAEAL